MKEKHRDDIYWKRLEKNILPANTIFCMRKLKQTSILSMALLPVSASFSSRWMFYVGKFQVLFSLSFCLFLWLVTAQLLLFWCAVWACCWSLGEYSRTATSSAEADKISVLPHSAAAAAADGLQHFTLVIWYITVFVSFLGLGSIWRMMTYKSSAMFKAKANKRKI